MSKKQDPSTPPPSDPNPSETPLQARPLANRQVCVYRVGQLLNQINWHAQQAWLLVDDQHASKVEMLLDELSLAARAAVPEPARASVEAVILSHGDWWGEGFDHPVHHNEHLLNVNETIRDTYACQDVDIAKVRADALAHIFPIDFHTALRDTCIRHLLAEQIPLLELGERVDQGLRPAGVSAWLYDPDIAADRVRNQNREGRPEPPWYVANRGLEPGELTPDRRWP
jgi:hypothetical protein